MTTLATQPPSPVTAVSPARGAWWAAQRTVVAACRAARDHARFARLRWLEATRRGPGHTRLAGLQLQYDDPRSLRFEYKHIFVQRLYDFRPLRPDARILDGGAHIGLSALRFKQLAPRARITAFEPDPRIIPMLRENLARNGADDVGIVEAALAQSTGHAAFAPDGVDGGTLASDRHPDPIHVPTVPLSDYLSEQVDFLKLNIEGAEVDVIRQAGPALRNVRQLAIEYHGFPELGERLGELLTMLADAGFRCVVHSFDHATNPAGQPPFRIRPATRWFALVAGTREPQ